MECFAIEKDIGRLRRLAMAALDEHGCGTERDQALRLGFDLVLASSCGLTQERRGLMQVWREQGGERDKAGDKRFFGARFEKAAAGRGNHDGIDNHRNTPRPPFKA